MRLDWQSAEVANAHVEKDCNEGNVGDERDEEHEFSVGELVHESSFLLEVWHRECKAMLGVWQREGWRRLTPPPSTYT